MKNNINYMPLQFPLPYTKMLAINSDVEFTTWDIQNSLFLVFAERSLEIAFSLWFFSENPATWAMFKSDGTPSQYWEDAIHLIKTGKLDTIHSFGGRHEFWKPSYTRDSIIKAYEKLQATNANLRIFTNHGITDDIQNVGGSISSYQKGDLPGTKLYHKDLSDKFGIKYYWIDTDYVIDKAFLSPSVGMPDSLFVLDKAQDGTSLLRFRRFLGKLDIPPDANNLKEQIEQVISYPTSGYCIIYQHLSVTRSGSRAPMPSSISLPLSKAFLKSLDFLKESIDRSKILFTTTEKLLNHALLMYAKPWNIIYSKNSLKIFFNEKITIGHNSFHIDKNFLQGWMIPIQDNDKVEAFINDLPVEIDVFKIANCFYAGFKWNHYN